MLVCTLLAICYVLFSSKTYSSHQTLVVRDNLLGTSFKPGQFDSLDSMKSAQETILEIARRPRVVRSALKQLGPTGFTSEEAWLSDAMIEESQKRIQIGAPNGAEFGRTEAIVLSVEASTRERSGKFITYLLDAIESSLRDLRGHQFDSMQHELEQAVSLASNAYSDSADKLRSFEKQVGPDLITLISMSDSQAGTNILQSEIANLNSEKRNAWANLQDVKKQIQILRDVENNPATLLEVPQELLQLQPTLASLASGLNEATLRYSVSKGRYKMRHPKVREDYRAVQDIKRQINDKLTMTLGSLHYQLELRQGKLDQLSNLVDEKKLRLAEVSGMRVDHTTLKSEVTKNRDINAKTQASLAEIKSLGSAAREVNLISRVDEPQTDYYASGPSNKLIVFGGMLAGFLIGLGLIMFIAPIDGLPGLPLDPVDFSGRGESQLNSEPNRPSHRSSEQYSEAASTPAATATPVAATASSDVLSTSDRIKARMEKIAGIARKQTPATDSDLTPNGEASSFDSEPVAETTTTSFDDSVDSLAATDATDNTLPPPFQNLGTNDLPDNDFGQDSIGIGDRSFDETGDASSILEHLRSAKAESALPETSEVHSSSPDLEAGLDEAAMSQSTLQETTEPALADPFAGLVEAEPTVSKQDGATDDDGNYDPYQRILASLPDLNSSSSSPAPPSTHGDASMAAGDSSLDFETPQDVGTSSDNMIYGISSGDQSSGSSQLGSETGFASPISSLTTRDNSQQSVAEKINQLDQLEQQNEDEFVPAIDPIKVNAAITAAEDLVGEPPSASTQAAGLPLPTSIQHSSGSPETIGDESVPNTGNQPDDRPTASPVDLEMLRRQIAARSANDNPDMEETESGSKTLTDVLTTYSSELEDQDTGKHQVVDKSMSDLAKSIRDMCKDQEDEFSL